MRRKRNPNLNVSIAACVIAVVAIGGLIIVSPGRAAQTWEGFSTSDLLNISVSLMALGVGVGALLLAQRQVLLGKRQVKLAKQQTASAARQEALDIDLASITRRQAEIVEGQNRISEEARQRRLDLRFRCRSQNASISSSSSPEPGAVTVLLSVLNGGNKTADGFYWEVFVPRELVFRVEFVNRIGDVVPSRSAPFSEVEIYDKRGGFYRDKLFPQSEVDITRVRVRTSAPSEFVLKWRLRTEDGLVPQTGLAQLRFVREEADWSFRITVPWPPPIAAEPAQR